MLLNHTADCTLRTQQAIEITIHWKLMMHVSGCSDVRPVDFGMSVTRPRLDRVRRSSREASHESEKRELRCDSISPSRHESTA